MLHSPQAFLNQMMRPFPEHKQNLFLPDQWGRRIHIYLLQLIFQFPIAPDWLLTNDSRVLSFSMPDFCIIATTSLKADTGTPNKTLTTNFIFFLNRQSEHMVSLISRDFSAKSCQVVFKKFANSNNIFTVFAVNNPGRLTILYD